MRLYKITHQVYEGNNYSGGYCDRVEILEEIPGDINIKKCEVFEVDDSFEMSLDKVEEIQSKAQLLKAIEDLRQGIIAERQHFQNVMEGQENDLLIKLDSIS